MIEAQRPRRAAPDGDAGEPRPRPARTPSAGAPSTPRTPREDRDARLRQALLRRLAHELRNPLAPVRTAVRVLALPGADAGHIERARDVIEHQVEALVRLLDEWLDGAAAEGAAPGAGADPPDLPDPDLPDPDLPEAPGLVADAPETDAPPAAQPGPGAMRRILVADDNADAVEMLAAFLRLSGHEVVTAADGHTAFDQANAWRPQLALLDIGMPGLDGYALARRLRHEPWGREMRIAALTGWGRATDQSRALRAGFDVHFTKPVDLDALVAWVGLH